MATDLANLLTRKAAITAELAALDSTKAGGKVNSSVDGESYDHVGYKMSLYRELEAINKQISAAEGPFEEESVFYT